MSFFSSKPKIDDLSDLSLSILVSSFFILYLFYTFSHLK